MFPSHLPFVRVLGCALIASAGALGAQQFTVSEIPGAVLHPSDLVAADFNGDGTLDFLIASVNPPTGGFSMMSRLSNGTWGTLGSWGFGQPSGMIAAELNGDGRPEALIAQNFPGWSGLNIYSFNSRMQVTGGSTMQSPLFGGRLAWIRGDTDASPDLFSFDSQAVSFHRHLGGYAFAPPVVTTTPWLPFHSEVLVADFDGDGLADRAAIVRNPTQPSQLEVARGDGFGSFLPAVIMALPPLALTPPSLLTDLNRDGLPDLIVDTRVLLNTGGGGFSLLPTVLAGRPCATGDFNGDGLPDILSLVGSTPSWVPQLQQPGMTFVGSGPGVGGNYSSKAFVLDVNQDGRLDILALHPQTSGPFIGLLATAVLPHAAPFVWPYGIRTPGCRGHIPLSANADPTLGLVSFAVTAANTPINAPGILLAYNGPQMWTFPLQLGRLGVTVHIDPAFAQVSPFVSDALGQAHFPLPIPAMGYFIFQFQAVWLAPTGDGACSDSPLGLVSSNVLQLLTH